MSRNFGIPARRRVPELLSPWAKDIIAMAFLVIFIGTVVSWLSIEFPNGIASLRAADLELVSNHR